MAPLALFIGYQGLSVDLQFLKANQTTTTPPTGDLWPLVVFARNLVFTVFVSLSSVSMSACQSGSATTDGSIVQSDSLDTNEPAEASASADLSADSLLPPEPVNVSLSSSNGLLTLSWDVIEDQQSSRIYEYDPLTGTESLISILTDANQNTFSLASLSHQRAWHRELLRVELCDSENCISSKRLSIADAIESTVQRITPSVFIENERFAESVSINSSATLMAVALPKQGAIDVYLKPANTWVASQRTTLTNLSPSTSRKFHMDFSATGDTLAVLILHENSVNTPEIRILERLGEGWFETNAISLNEISNSVALNTRVQVENPITISDNGTLILLNIANQAYTLSLTNSDWSSPAQLTHSSIQGWDDNFTDRFINEGSLKTMSASAALDRIFLAHSIDQSLWLSLWQLQSTSTATPVWEKTAAYPINAIAPQHEILIRSNDEGNQIFIAGWESLQSIDRTPVAWRFQLPQINQGVDGTSLSSLDSIRFPPTNDTSASIRFSTDAALNQVVLGWQGTDVNSASPDAALTTYTYSTDSMRWIPKLELPEVYPTFAKQAFVRSTKVSADGSALLISIAAGDSLSSDNRVGELLSLH